MQFAADDFSTIRRRRDELRGGSLGVSCGNELDSVGQAYHIHRKPAESDHEYRERIEIERRKV